MNEEVEIVLSDGYTFKAKVNGNTYYTETVVDASKLTDTNLASMTIDGQKYENMTCTAHNNEYVCFRQFTQQELDLAAINEAIADLAGIVGGE